MITVAMMRAAGLTDVQIAALKGGEEEERTRAKREASRQRQIAWRARKKA